MKVFEYIKEKRKITPLHFTLIDPDKQSPEQAGEFAKKAKESGSDAIMIGGSQPDLLMYLDETVKEVKKRVGDIPVILFPFSHSALSKHADAVFFMSLLNSRSTQYIIEEQMRGSVVIAKHAIEPLSMAYLIIESGKPTSAEFGGDAKPIPRKKPEFAVGYALAARYFGMKFVYLEGGSGAEKPVTTKMVAMVKKAVGEDVFVIVGGGIRDSETAKSLASAGADIFVTGTIGEEDPEKFKEIIKSIKEGSITNLDDYVTH
ncbi:MAG: geranylgeranylglyceryl/heptaprenylglyceryl phosphate synthase [Candidatus Aenigmarchaeota archaeon]|nr:geranylgeranylglyceryl/heptaprenylglyceryl phosphate synthase [Candidatus Aenigmarchaeota archaeon]